MGCGGSVASKQNAIIEMDLRKQLNQTRNVIKLLLLGTGECGKSTILKQMKILHSNGFSEQEMKHERQVIYGNCVLSMVVMIKAMDKLHIPLIHAQLISDACTVTTFIEENKVGDSLSAEIHEALQRLWADQAVQQVYSRRSEYQLADCTEYFMDNLSRIADENYTPNEKDVLYSRTTTTGIVEVALVIKGPNDILQDFIIYDVGGQRSERRKWIHCFDDVDALLFLVAISEYDQTLFEDESQNRLTEAIGLFRSICSSTWFTNTSIILFLNKIDLFKQKIQKGITIQQVFPKYEGENTFEATSAYIMKYFIDQRSDKPVYAHFTCATNTGQVKFVLDNVTNMIIDQYISNIVF